jgi:KaiC/GvpD/RAD55 family RecA-like ATPase
MKTKRIETHIPGLDNLIEQGFPQGSSILLSGTAGTGKTIFSLQYLYNGATQEKDKCIYFTFEEKRQSLIDQAKQFNWDLEKLEKSKKLKIISMGVDNINKEYIDEIFEIIKNFKPKRVVIDSINTLAFLTSSDDTTNLEYATKKFIYYFLAKFKSLTDITSIFISQKNTELSNTIAEYICDGVIKIEYESLGGDYSRHLSIQKMRKTKNDEDIHPLEISEKGITVHNM